jgi:hypothetical protein
MMRFTFVVLVLGCLALAAPAMAQAPKDERPAGTIGSGAITIEQIKNEVVEYTAKRNGINVFFVLPRGWELQEEGLDKKTGSLVEGVPAYMLLSRAPVAKPEDPTDLIFELRIYEKGLTQDLPKDMSAEDRDQKARFKAFLDSQLSQALSRGWKVMTDTKDIVPKPYGPKDRPYGQTAFVPIFYQTKEGAMLYTFTTVTWDSVWMMSFLVTKDQTDNYGALMALMLDNSFALTDQQFDAVQKAQQEALKKLEEEGKLGKPGEGGKDAKQPAASGEAKK